jgi:O-antigen ligase
MSMTATTPTAGGNLAWALAGALGVALLGAAWGFAVAIGEVNALLLCAAAIACLFVLLDFRVGVVLLILAMPVSASTVFPHQMFGITGLNPLNLVIVTTLFSYLAHALQRGGLAGFMPRRLFWLYLVPFVIAGLMGLRHVDEIPAVVFVGELVAYNNATGYVRDVILRPAFVVVFALLLGAAAARSLQPRRFLAPMMVSVWMMGLMVIGFVIASGADLSELSSGFARSFLSPLGVHANELGRLYAVAYALLLFPLVETRDFALRLALGATIVLLVVALALTFSRGAFVGFIVVNALFLLWRRSVFTWIAGAFLIALLAWKLPGAIGDRLTMGFGSDLNTITAGRMDEIWTPLMPTFWESPVFGQGLSSILWSAPLKAGQMLEVSHPHNAYLQTLLDMGVVGLVLLLAYFVPVWRKLRRLGEDPSLDPVERGIYAGAAAGMIGFAVAAFGGSSLTPAAEQCYLWFAIGLMYGRLSQVRPAQGSADGR